MGIKSLYLFIQNSAKKFVCKKKKKERSNCEAVCMRSFENSFLGPSVKMVGYNAIARSSGFRVFFSILFIHS